MACIGLRRAWVGGRVPCEIVTMYQRIGPNDVALSIRLLASGRIKDREGRSERRTTFEPVGDFPDSMTIVGFVCVRPLGLAHLIFNFSRPCPRCVPFLQAIFKKGCRQYVPGTSAPHTSQTIHEILGRWAFGAHYHMDVDVAARHSSGPSAVPSAAEPCASQRDGATCRSRTAQDASAFEHDLDAHGSCEQAGPVGWGEPLTLA